MKMMIDFYGHFCAHGGLNGPSELQRHSVLMLCDSGADGPLVNSRFVAPTDYLDANIRIRLADGRVVQLPGCC